MTREDLILYLENPELLSRVKTEEIDILRKQYPYCNTLQLMGTKALMEQHDLTTEGSIRKSSAYASDRFALKKLLESTTITIEEEETDEVILEQELPSTANEPIERKTDSLETLILSHAIDSSIQLEVADIQSEDTESDNDPEAGETFETFTKDEHTEPLSFIDFIFTNDPESGTKLKKSQSAEDRLTDFIKSKEQRIQERKPFFSSTRLAQESLEDASDLVSETLAKLYFVQGNYDKALKAYNSLSLKYPEKSVYFAAQIEKIKALQGK